MQSEVPPSNSTLSDHGDWRKGLIRIGCAWAVLFVLFAADWWTMAHLWWDISTYNHILFVPLILIWLVWMRCPELKLLPSETWWPALVLVTGAASLWLLGAVSEVNLAKHIGLVGMLVGVVPLMLGWRVGLGLLFPLSYALFLVPFGDELVHILQTITADITIWLTELSGIPAKVNGVFIDTPAGLFEVAEACSGVKFLIAMIAFGALAANVCFISWARRLFLMLTCIVTPILANGIRAWGTVYIAQVAGIDAAVGFDHIVYGWFFFAFVLVLIFIVARPFMDRPVDSPMINAAKIKQYKFCKPSIDTQVHPVVLFGAFVCIVTSVFGWTYLANSLQAKIPVSIDLPKVDGWTRVDYKPELWWEPKADGADHRLLGRYRDASGREVDVFVAVYAQQNEGSEAGAFGQGALPDQSHWSWLNSVESLHSGTGDLMLGEGRVTRTAMTWYQHGQLVTGNTLKLKMAIAADRLRLKASPTSTLILSVEGDSAHSREAISHFLVSIGPIGNWLDTFTEARLPS